MSSGIVAGSRVVLRNPRRTDEAEFLALVRRSRAFHRGWGRPPDTPTAFARYRQRSRGKDNEMFLIRRREDDVLIGALELSQIVRGLFKSTYLGYWIGAPHARQGLMTEAVALSLSIAFRRLRLHRVEANVQPQNLPSIALLRRLGFRQEGYSPRYLKIGGRWRDHERWALLADEWRPTARLHST